MKFLTTAAILSLAVAQGVYAVDFDFRDFEGLWESNEVEVVRFDLDFTDLPPDIVPLAQDNLSVSSLSAPFNVRPRAIFAKRCAISRFVNHCPSAQTR